MRIIDLNLSWIDTNVQVNKQKSKEKYLQKVFAFSKHLNSLLSFLWPFVFMKASMNLVNLRKACCTLNRQANYLRFPLLQV